MIALPNPTGSVHLHTLLGIRRATQLRPPGPMPIFADSSRKNSAMPCRLCPALLDDRQIQLDRWVAIRCAPWSYQDKVALVVDAAHAVCRFYGQGMNAAFEDCVVLDECLAEFLIIAEIAFTEYFSRRKRTPTRWRPCRRQLRRDARQDRVAGIPGEEEVSTASSRVCSPVCTSRSTPWSRLRAFPTPKPPAVRAGRIALSMRA